MGKRIFFTIGLAITLALFDGDGLWGRLQATSVSGGGPAAVPPKPVIRLDSPLDGWALSRNGTFRARKLRGL